MYVLYNTIQYNTNKVLYYIFFNYEQGEAKGPFSINFPTK